MARPKRQEDPLLPVPLPRRRPSRANTRNLAASVKPELAAEIKSLAEREQTSVAALVEEATINLRSEEHTSELQSLMRNSYAVFCLNKKTKSSAPQIRTTHNTTHIHT